MGDDDSPKEHEFERVTTGSDEPCERECVDEMSSAELVLEYDPVDACSNNRPLSTGLGETHH